MTAAEKSMRVPLLKQGIDPWPGWSRADLLAVAGLVLASLALRIPGLDQQLWVDEALTLLGSVRLPAAEIINRAGQTNNHVLYSLCAHYATAWLGEHHWVLRLPALVFGVAAIPATYLLGRQIAGRQEALLAALFMALNYQFVWYSQNARGYTGLLLGALVVTILFIRLMSDARPSVRLIVAYAAVGALTAWIHLTAVFVLLAHGLIWFVLALKPNRDGQVAAVMPVFAALLLSGLFTLALYTPLFTAVRIEHTAVSDGTSGFVAAADEYTEEMLSPATKWVLGEYARGLQRSIPGGWLMVVAVILVLFTGIGSYLRQNVAVAGLLLLPALITWAVIYSRGLLFFPRFLFGSAAFLVLIAVRGGFSSAQFALPFLTRRQILLLGSLVALAGAAMVPAAWKPKQDYEGAAGFIREHRLPGDAVVCVGTVHFVLHNYLGLDCESAMLPSRLLQIEKQHERTWLLYTAPTQLAAQTPVVWRRIQDSGEYVKVTEFEGTLSWGNIVVLLRSPARPAAAPEQVPR